MKSKTTYFIITQIFIRVYSKPTPKDKIKTKDKNKDKIEFNY